MQHVCCMWPMRTTACLPIHDLPSHARTQAGQLSIPNEPPCRHSAAPCELCELGIGTPGP